MTGHRCITGYHETPSRACRVGHAGDGCRCAGCREADAAYSRARWRGLPLPTAATERRLAAVPVCGQSVSVDGGRQGRCGAPCVPGSDRCADHHHERVVASWWPLPLPTIPAEAAAGWRDRAACVGHPNPDAFYPGKGHNADTSVIAACVACPVRGDCLADALADPGTEDHGVRGGTAPRDRAALRRRLGMKRVPEPARVCGARVGTDAGYKAHQRAGDEPCDRCRRAHADYAREYTARKRGAA
jgi:WhiB family transcriptional regulator, redox-sensing transcriptional regulator